MMPTFWPAQRAAKNVLKDLWLPSSGFYIRTKEPTNDDKTPEVRIGYIKNMGWGRDGDTYTASVFMGETHLDGGTLRVPTSDALKTPTLRATEFAKGVVPSADYGLPSAQNQIANSARRAAVVEASFSRAIFYRLPGGVAVGNYNFMALNDPPGSRSWQFNADAVRLTSLAANGPVAYDHTISSRSHVYCCAAGGTDVADRAKIIGYQGLTQADGGQDEVPKWITIGGEQLKGTPVVNKPVGRIGEDRLIFQQASIVHTENPNPATGYQRQNGYVKVKNAQGVESYEEVPFNQYANWQNSPATRYLWSGYCYEVEIAHTIDQQGKATANATRTLKATAEWEWALKPNTGVDPNTGQVYVYTREYVYQNGQWIYVYTLTTEKVPPQYIPKLKVGEGVVLCAIMGTRSDGIVRKELAWNAPNYTEQLPGGASQIPGGLAEINQKLWLAVSRITTGSSGGSRWMYSRDKGQSWTLIGVDYTNSGGTGSYKGQNTVRKDMELVSKERYEAAIAAEVVLAPKA